MYGWTALPWIGPGRTSATCTVRSSRFSGRVRSRLCICARLSIWKTPTVSARLDLGVDRRVVERHAREVDRLAVQARDRVDARPRPRDSIPSPSRSILRKPASEQESLSHWQSCRPAIAAGWTGTRSISGRVETIMPPGCCETWRGRPAISRVSSRNASQRGPAWSPGRASSSSATRLGVPAVGDAREPLELAERQAERLADVADRAAAAVGGEARDERGVLAAVALGDGDDQLLADVAREVEVDVGHGGHLVVEEAAERELRLDRVDVREAGQVADDRADARPAAAARRQRVARRAGAAHLEGALARELEHLPVEEEEAGEPEARDQRELLVEALRARACGRWRSRSARRRRGRRRRGAGRRPGRGRRRSRGSGSRAPASGRMRSGRRPRACARRRRAAGARASRRGGSRTDSWLPRRSGSQPSSEVRLRIATSASWRRVRRGWCAWTSPVATVGTPSVAASSSSAAFRRASPRSYGRCSST